ncbi:MAG TPA: hypothetical protein VIN06_15535 [Devosia sp.]
MGLASAQEQGWHYSPLPGEGDRAAMGCSHGATPEKHTCLVVRCEDDFSVGVHIHTSRAGTDAGRWRIEFDKGDPAYDIVAVEDGSPYGARVEGDVEPILFGLRNLGLVYLDPQDGAEVDQQISLNGSLYVINQALYFCAPRAVPEASSGDEKPAVDGQDGAGDEARQR